MHILLALPGCRGSRTLQVHYTTYDLRREYDTINPRTHSDIMVLSGETNPQHPYWYARVLGIYHMDVWFKIEGSMKMRQVEVLYVRWLAPLIGHRSGMSVTRLPKVAFVEESDRDAFGFLDFARQGDELDDWEAFYVGM